MLRLGCEVEVLRLVPRGPRSLRLVSAALASAAVLVACHPASEKSNAGLDPVQQALRDSRAKGIPTVVEFGANACSQCREMKLVLAQIAGSHNGRVSIVDVDVLRERAYLARYDIRVLPTQVYYDAAGAETSRHTGAMGATGVLDQLGLADRSPENHAQ